MPATLRFLYDCHPTDSAMRAVEAERALDVRPR